MADQVFTYDSQGEWEGGDLDNVVAFDPAGKLVPTMDATRVANYLADSVEDMTVYCRCRDASGSTIVNHGDAADGTAASHTWQTKTDGRSYLRGGTVTIPYNASMAIANANGDKFDIAGGLACSFPSFSAQVLMTRANRFKLGIDASNKPYASYYDGAGAWQTATAGDALDADTWYRLSMSINNGHMNLYVNGAVKSYISGITEREDAGSGDLVVACTGDYRDFWLYGEGTYNDLSNQPSTGNWEKIIDLTGDGTLRHIVAVCDLVDAEHSISISVAFDDDEDNLDYVEKWSWPLGDGTNRLYPPKLGLLHGQYMKIKTTLSGSEQNRTLPILDSMVVTTRTPGTALGTWKADRGIYQVLAKIEERVPESLPDVIRVIVRIIERVNDLQEKFTPYGPGPTGPADEGPGTDRFFIEDIVDDKLRFHNGDGFAHGKVQMRYNEHENATAATASVGCHGVFAPYSIIDSNFVNLTANNAIAAHAGDASAHHTKYTDGAAELVITAELVNGQSIDNAIDSLIGTHAAVNTNVHGAGATGIADNAAVGTAVSNHAAVSMNIHGLTGDKYVAGSTYEDQNFNTAIASHNASDGKHGLSGGVHVAGANSANQNLENELNTHTSASNPHSSSASDTDLSNHAATHTSVHGCTHVAEVDDITSAIGVHEGRCDNYLP